jgi:hypothetical protein
MLMRKSSIGCELNMTEDETTKDSQTVFGFGLTKDEADYIEHIRKRFDSGIDGPATISHLVVHPGIIEMAVEKPSLYTKVFTSQISPYGGWVLKLWSFTNLVGVETDLPRKTTTLYFRIQRTNVGPLKRLLGDEEEDED